MEFKDFDYSAKLLNLSFKIGYYYLSDMRGLSKLKERGELEKDLEEIKSIPKDLYDICEGEVKLKIDGAKIVLERTLKIMPPLNQTSA